MAIHKFGTRVSLWDNREWLLHEEKVIIFMHSIIDIPKLLRPELFFSLLHVFYKHGFLVIT